jgi:hypothetical protein
VSGHCTAPVFTGASSNIADLSSLDTLPPFPKCAGSPRLGVLRRLRPLHAVSWHRAYPCAPPGGKVREGTVVKSSHVHCCPVDR